MENDAVADSTTDTAVLDSIMKTGLRVLTTVGVIRGNPRHVVFAVRDNGHRWFADTHSVGGSIISYKQVGSRSDARWKYADGRVCERNDNLPTKFTAVPKQNYNDVDMPKRRVRGNLSNLRYFSHALSAFEINNIVKGRSVSHGCE
jgi:hypothetical protein